MPERPVLTRALGLLIQQVQGRVGVEVRGDRPHRAGGRVDHEAAKVPRSLEVHDGHDGGPIIEFPGSLVRMDVY